MEEAYIEYIEKGTREQRNSLLWREVRKNRITASKVGAIMNCKRESSSLVNYFLYPPTFQTRATLHGLQYESEALHNYEQFTGLKVKSCGFYIHKDLPFLGASPDGVVNEKVIVEVKCPYSAKGKKIDTVCVPYLQDGINGLELKENHIYYWQVMCQLEVTGKETCHFIVYTVADFILIEIKRNDTFIENMKQEVVKFFNNQMVPAIKNKYIYKNYNLF